VTGPRHAAPAGAPDGELLYSESEYVRCSSGWHDGGRPHPENAQCSWPHNAGHFRRLADRDEPGIASPERADEIANARDLQELAARNLAAATEDLTQARQAVAVAERECDRAAAALSRVDPDAPPLRTVADIRGQVRKWEDTYLRTASGLSEGSARDSMRSAAGAMSSVLRFIDGEA
jgi:hypothetical protein